MNYPDTIYRRSLALPEPAAREALDFIDFLLQRYGTRVDEAPPPGQSDARNEWLRALAGSWGSDIPDDIDGADLPADAPRDAF